MNPFDDWSVSLPVKICITCLRGTPRELENLCITFFDDFVGWAAHQTVFSVACDSDSDILAVLQTVETVVRTQIHRLDFDKFQMFSIGWTWQRFRGDLNPWWFE